MTSQSGSPFIPGLASDGQMPGGVTVAGALVAGDPAAAIVPSFHNFYGSLHVQDSPGNNTDGDAPLSVSQNKPVQLGDFAVAALDIHRQGDVSAADYQLPAVLIADESASLQPMLTARKGATTQFQVDADGVQVHGKFKTGAAVTHTIGSYSGKSVPVYDEAGTLLGYMPLYA